MIVLYILLFILMLSILILVHELGHLAAAKFFKVYCLDFSIGFGKAFFHKKRKNGETYFSLRVIPFGGFVSMYGEGVEVPEGLTIPPERAFNKIKKWKRIIILFAGVFNNIILAFILFFISNFAFTQRLIFLNGNGDTKIISPQVEVVDNSIASRAGICNLSYIEAHAIKTGEVKDGQDVYSSGYYLIDKEAVVSTDSGAVSNVAAVLTTNNLSFDSRDFKDFIKFYELTSDTAYEGINLKNEVTAKTAKTASYSLIYKDGIDATETHKTTINLGRDVSQSGEPIFESPGISYHITEFRYNFGQSCQKMCENFAESTTVIFRSIGQLFTSAEAWNNIGGIIAIGQSTTQVLTSMGWGTFLYYWGMISVNLFIINLLPFPGLDGWQILVLAVEMIAHKEIPEKVKNVVSFIGITLLFIFMILILIKDVIGLF